MDLCWWANYWYNKEYIFPTHKQSIYCYFSYGPTLQGLGENCCNEIIDCFPRWVFQKVIKALACKKMIVCNSTIVKSRFRLEPLCYYIPIRFFILYSKHFSIILTLIFESSENKAFLHAICLSLLLYISWFISITVYSTLYDSIFGKAICAIKNMKECKTQKCRLTSLENIENVIIETVLP